LKISYKHKPEKNKLKAGKTLNVYGI